jgi:hypothetical protein
MHHRRLNTQKSNNPSPALTSRRERARAYHALPRARNQQQRSAFIRSAHILERLFSVHRLLLLRELKIVCGCITTANSQVQNYFVRRTNP